MGYKVSSGVTGQGDVIQSASTVLAVDATTTSLTYVNLLTLTVSTYGGTCLEVYFSYATSNSLNDADTGQDYLRITVDGTQLQQSGAEQWPVTESGAIFVKTNVLASGSHVVNADWHTTTGGTLRCSARTLTRPEHASLMVLETPG